MPRAELRPHHGRKAGSCFRPIQASNRQEDRIIATKLFVGNIAFSTTQSELTELFGELGEVNEVFIPTDRDSGRPRGFAFVEFVDKSSATAAIEKFDGYEMGGRNLRVNEAEQRPPGPRFRSGPNEGGGGAYDAPKRFKPKGSRKNMRARKRGF